MELLNSIKSEIAVSIVTAIIMAVIGAIYIWIKTRSVSAVRHLGVLVRFADRWHSAGISNFFRSRADYTRFREQPSASGYIKTTKTSLKYVGFWLAESGEIDDITESIRELIHSGKNVQLTLLNPQSPEIVMETYARFFALDIKVLRDRTSASLNMLRHFRGTLVPAEQLRFRIHLHSEFTGSSAFLFDDNTSDAKALVDFKFFAKRRELTFGLEVKPNGSNDGLYRRIVESFHQIESHSSAL